MVRGLSGTETHMTRTIRYLAIIPLAFMAGACVQVGHIQQTKPVRTLEFTGSHKSVAQCIQRRVGGKVQDDSFGERYVIYDSAKRNQAEGLTHYAITVGRIGADKGFAEWRIMRPPSDGPPSARRPIPKLSDTMLEQYWKPVQDCAAQAKGSQ
jgi:hypothetical protein